MIVNDPPTVTSVRHSRGNQLRPVVLAPGSMVTQKEAQWLRRSIRVTPARKTYMAVCFLASTQRER